MRRRLVLFDIDGTLISAAGAGRKSLERAFGSVFGVADASERARGVPFEGRTDPLIIEDMARACGIDVEALRSREAEFRDAYLAFLLEEMARPDPRRRVMPGILPLLDALERTSAVVLGLLTGNIEAGARTKLEPFRLNRYFPDGGFSSDHPERAEIARIAREKLERRSGIRFEPERVVVVGDTDQDVACARANGYRAVVLDSGFVSRERILAAKPDAHFADATDLEAMLVALGVGEERYGHGPETSRTRPRSPA